jgi:Ala-tRNA(Pro) deacylase
MNIKEFLTKRHVRFEVLPHEHSYGASRLAQAVHAHGREVAKTVLLHANHGFTDVVAVVPSNCHVNLERARELLGGAELNLANEEDIRAHCPDCEVGVLPPFGSQYGMRTMMDESLAKGEEIVFESNTHNEAIRMRTADFFHAETPLVGAFAEANP